MHPDRLTEGLTLLRVLQGILEGRTSDTEGPRGDLDAAGLEAFHHLGEALALGLGPLDGSAPVDLDAEIARPHAPTAPVGREHDWDAGHGARFCLELRDRLARREPADVDAGDLDSRRDPVGRTCERKADERRGDHADGRQREQPAGKQLPRPGTPAPAEPDRARSCFDPQGRKSSVGLPGAGLCLRVPACGTSGTHSARSRRTFV